MKSINMKLWGIIVDNKRSNRIAVCIMSILLIFLFQQFASKCGGFVADLFDYSFIDKDNAFLWISVHHVVQMFFALLIISILHKKAGLNFGLKIKKDAIGIKYVIVFSIVIIGYVVTSYIVGYANNSIEAYPYDLNGRNIMGTLGFQLLLSGTSEELLFRALPITVLCYVFSEHKNRWIEIFIAATLFSIAHISWTIRPFSITFSVFQMIYAFVLGVIYGKTYVKTKSIIYPIIMHSLSNVFMVGFGYVFAYIVK